MDLHVPKVCFVPPSSYYSYKSYVASPLPEQMHTLARLRSLQREVVVLFLSQVPQNESSFKCSLWESGIFRRVNRTDNIFLQGPSKVDNKQYHENWAPADVRLNHYFRCSFASFAVILNKRRGGYNVPQRRHWQGNTSCVLLSYVSSASLLSSPHFVTWTTKVRPVRLKLSTGLTVIVLDIIPISNTHVINI